jgi:hypothetical protein
MGGTVLLRWAAHFSRESIVFWSKGVRGGDFLGIKKHWLGIPRHSRYMYSCTVQYVYDDYGLIKLLSKCASLYMYYITVVFELRNLQNEPIVPQKMGSRTHCVPLNPHFLGSGSPMHFCV